jgi:CRISPR/Cas system CSM-associated protein Csm3 (group 7 of RAMP superfamily)
MTNKLKGDTFLNRYRITGTLTTVTPLHIGTGEQRQASRAGNETVQISTIATDHRNKPLIPGSTLRGVLRNWLLTVLEGVGQQWAADRDYGDQTLLALSQPDQIARVRRTFSRLELLFGTPFNAGKVEVWDALCVTNDLAQSDHLLGWDAHRLTYVDTSVAIDPDRGTAQDKLLYKADIVPPGVAFEINLAAQNLSDEELGMLLLALEGFNSTIYPIHVGARAGRGYGRMAFTVGPIYHLDRSGMSDWLKSMLQVEAEEAQPAGFYQLPQLSAADQKQRIDKVKRALQAALGG